EAVDNAVFVGRLDRRPCVTESLRIHGWCQRVNGADPLHYYGADAAAIEKLITENAAWGEQLHAGFPYRKAQVIWAVRNEMAMTVEDVLSRRIRMLFLDAHAAIQAAPEVARLMAEEMGKDESWQEEQLQNFTVLAEGYLLGI